MGGIDMSMLLDPSKGPYIGGHRGAAGYFPENTMLSFEKGVELGADLIELDVHLSKDGIPVIIHNHTLDETTNGKGRVNEYTLEELKRLDAGSWFSKDYAGLQIPTLEEALLWAKGKVWVSIELKQNPYRYEGLEEKVVRVIEATEMRNDVQLMSSDHYAIKRIKELDGGLMTSMICHCKLVDPVKYAREIGADIMNTSWHFLSKDIVEQAHQAGLMVHGGLSNDPDLWVMMQEWNIDMVDTDTPDVLKRVTKQRA
jgi:glycerophosphoryl diester phosphodiesterase